MNEPGRGLAYAALFSEIGITLLVTTLAGALGGNLLDERLGSSPIFALTGFLVGAGIGTWGIYKLVSRFLATIE